MVRFLVSVGKCSFFSGRNSVRLWTSGSRWPPEPGGRWAPGLRKNACLGSEPQVGVIRAAKVDECRFDRLRRLEWDLAAHQMPQSGLCRRQQKKCWLLLFCEVLVGSVKTEAPLNPQANHSGPITGRTGIGDFILRYLHFWTSVVFRTTTYQYCDFTAAISFPFKSQNYFTGMKKSFKKKAVDIFSDGTFTSPSIQQNISLAPPTHDSPAPLTIKMRILSDYMKISIRQNTQ